MTALQLLHKIVLKLTSKQNFFEKLENYQYKLGLQVLLSFCPKEWYPHPTKQYYINLTIINSLQTVTNCVHVNTKRFIKITLNNYNLARNEAGKVYVT